jgi:hypothetical protein
VPASFIDQEGKQAFACENRRVDQMRDPSKVNGCLLQNLRRMTTSLERLSALFTKPSQFSLKYQMTFATASSERGARHEVCRSALALNVPHRDLYLSPLHALYLDGALIKVGVVVNGRSIVRCSNYKADRLSYFHLELEDHQVIFAEGTPVESRLEERMIPFAPIWGGGRRFELRSRLRSAISPWVDGRQIFDKVRDRLDTRGELDLAL